MPRQIKPFAKRGVYETLSHQPLSLSAGGLYAPDGGCVYLESGQRVREGLAVIREILNGICLALAVTFIVCALIFSGVLQIRPLPDTANLEGRVTELEKVTGIKPNGQLVVPEWEKGK